MQEDKQEKSQIKQNILLYLKSKGVTPYEFYKESGVTRGILQQNNGISEDNIARFLAYAPDISTDWLLTGRGNMLRGDEQSLISHAPNIGVPYYDVDFVAGFDTIINDQTIVPAHNIVFAPFKNAQLWCNVTGNSMANAINPGDLIALREISLDSILYGEIYAVVLDDIRTIKIIRKSSDPNKLRFIPINNEYDEQEFDKSRIIKIYSVLGSIHKFF